MLKYKLNDIDSNNESAPEETRLVLALVPYSRFIESVRQSSCNYRYTAHISLVIMRSPAFAPIAFASQT